MSSVVAAPPGNEFPRTRGHGVGRHRPRMQPMALDMLVAGIPIAQLRDATLSLHLGGASYYASDFVQVDVGLW